jgi:hypothetical protein
MKSLVAGLVNGSARQQAFLEPHNPLFCKEFTVFFGLFMHAVTVKENGPDFNAELSADSGPKL